MKCAFLLNVGMIFCLDGEFPELVSLMEEDAVDYGMSKTCSRRFKPGRRYLMEATGIP